MRIKELLQNFRFVIAPLFFVFCHVGIKSKGTESENYLPDHSIEWISNSGSSFDELSINFAIFQNIDSDLCDTENNPFHLCH